MTNSTIKALAFDVFGTVVDYRGTIIREGEQLNRAKGLPVDWGQFADAWRARYRPSMDLVMRGELPWTTLDTLHRLSLNDLLSEFQLGDCLSQEEQDHLNHVWHRLLHRLWAALPVLARCTARDQAERRRPLQARVPS